jgi:parvulin-like peptidyl-prolyl isomerase
MSDLAPSLQDTLQKMKPGEITETLRVPRGFQILKLETIKPATVPPFESVRQRAGEKVVALRQRREIRKFLNRVRGQAIIEWKNAELKKAYEQELESSMSSGPAGG